MPTCAGSDPLAGLRRVLCRRTKSPSVQWCGFRRRPTSSDRQLIGKPSRDAVASRKSTQNDHPIRNHTKSQSFLCKLKVLRHRFGNRRQNTAEDLPRTRRASGHRHIDRDYRGDATARGIAFAEYSPAATAVANCHDELRVRHCIVSTAQRHLHIFGDRPRDRQ